MAVGKKMLLIVTFKCIFCAIKSKSSAIIFYPKHFLLLNQMGLIIFYAIILITPAERLAYTVVYNMWSCDLQYVIMTHIFKNIHFIQNYIFKNCLHSRKEVLHFGSTFFFFFNWRGKIRKYQASQVLFNLSLICPQTLLKNIVSSTAWRLFSGENECFNCDIVFPFDTPFNL